MRLNKEEKKKAAEAFARELKGTSTLYFTEYQGLKFQDLLELRKRLLPSKLRFRVVRNSIARNALQESGLTAPAASTDVSGACEGKGKASWDSLLTGPVALVYGEGDPFGAVKVLVSFSKDFPQLKIKAGFLENQWFLPKECIQFSKVGSRQELLAQIAFALQQTITQIASVVQAPMRDLALVLRALEEQKKEKAT